MSVQSAVSQARPRARGDNSCDRWCPFCGKSALSFLSKLVSNPSFARAKYPWALFDGPGPVTGRKVHVPQTRPGRLLMKYHVETHDPA